MFLRRVLDANPGLIRTAVKLHRAGAIPPNCFVLDIDAIGHNAELLAAEARRLDMRLYFMSKQIGHNPEAVAAIREAGITRAVAVDTLSAAVLREQGVEIGNVGHLSQIPTARLGWAVALRPDVVTIFDTAKAEHLSAAAVAAGRGVDVMLRLWTDDVLPGQEGGFRLEVLEPAAKSINALPGLRVVGVTAFPCVTYAERERRYRPTANLHALSEAAAVLRDGLRFPVEHVNAPGASCVEVLPLLRRAGATVAEPGHAFTGTNPHHADGHGVERPAMVYVSEVSHISDGTAWAFGGGLYRRGGVTHALVGRDDGLLDTMPVATCRPDAEFIDYYFAIDIAEHDVHVGDTVVCAFRSQIFVSYTSVAAVGGISDGSARLLSLTDTSGNPYKFWGTR